MRPQPRSSHPSSLVPRQGFLPAGSRRLGWHRTRPSRGPPCALEALEALEAVSPAPPGASSGGTRHSSLGLSGVGVEGRLLHARGSSWPPPRRPDGGGRQDRSAGIGAGGPAGQAAELSGRRGSRVTGRRARPGHRRPRAAHPAERASPPGEGVGQLG